jgi:RIO kinase 2
VRERPDLHRGLPLSATDIAAGLIMQLRPEEWQVLRALEKCTLGKATTSAESLAKVSGQPLDRVTFGLSELNKRKLVSAGRTHEIYAPAIDLLALKFYADKDYAHALGKLIAKGKESDVYEVLSGKGELYALKLFRLGRTSFRDVARKRHASPKQLNTWLDVNYQAAHREFNALVRLSKVTKNVPVAVATNRHTVLLKELPGVRLTNRPELVDPEKVLREIVDTVREVYSKTGMINGDLSEYNILTDGAVVWLIDWPQWVGKDHPNAKELLKRDVGAVARFFGRSYGVAVDADALVRYVSEGGRYPDVRIG